jgi:hypothetical protein
MHRGIFLKFLDHRTTVNADHYCTSCVTWRKPSGRNADLLTEKMILIHNDATPCSKSHSATPRTVSLGVSCLIHHTCPRDFHLIVLLKKHMEQDQLHDDVCQRGWKCRADFLSTGIKEVVHYLDICLNCSGDYTEKY